MVLILKYTKYSVKNFFEKNKKTACLRVKKEIKMSEPTYLQGIKSGFEGCSHKRWTLTLQNGFSIYLLQWLFKR